MENETSVVKITAPLSESAAAALRAGDRVLISGTIYTARDAAHKKLCRLIAEGAELPLPLKGAVIYYVGPTPARPGEIIGSAGPTTSGRMDSYAPLLLELGCLGMIGKGERSRGVEESIVKNKAVYFAATGGAGALISKSIKSVETVAYPELQSEAICRLTVESFPAIVAIDSLGGNLYRIGQNRYLKSIKG